jgi:hypothetical protein
MLSLERILIDSAILSLLIGVIILGSLIYNPRLWLQDYPAEVKTKVPPNTPQEKRQQRLLIIPFLLVMLGGPIYSTYLLRLEYGGTIPFLIAYASTFFVTNILNLFDAVVIDLLILTLMKPRFAVIPGAENMEHLNRNWSMHLKNYVKGVVIMSVLSLPLAAVALVL